MNSNHKKDIKNKKVIIVTVCEEVPENTRKHQKTVFNALKDLGTQFKTDTGEHQGL